MADESDNPVEWLSPPDFVLSVGGKERRIESLDRAGEHPAAIAVIVDVSESLRIRRRDSFAPRLAAECVSASTLSMWLARRNPIFIADFARHFHVMETYTTDDLLLDRAFEQISLDNEFGEESASLYDSIIKGTVVLAHGPSPRRALIVLTDGDDTISAHGVEDAVAAAERAGVSVYVLVFGSGPFFLPLTAIGAAANYRYRDNLFRITSESGGRGFVVDDRDRAAVIRAARKVAADINGQYLLGFEVLDSERGVQPVEVRVKNHPGLEVRAPRMLSFSRAADARLDPGA